MGIGLRSIFVIKFNNILLSIRPIYVDKIAKGIKNHELRRSTPKIKTGDLGFIYATNPIKALVGKFKIGQIISGKPYQIWQSSQKTANFGLRKDTFDQYFKGSNHACAIEILDYKPLNITISREDLINKYNIHPPQSYRYLSTATYNHLINSNNL